MGTLTQYSSTDQNIVGYVVKFPSLRFKHCTKAVQCYDFLLHVYNDGYGVDTRSPTYCSDR